MQAIPGNFLRLCENANQAVVQQSSNPTLSGVFRNPYMVVRIPWWVKLYKQAYDNASVAKPHRDRDPRRISRAVVRALARLSDIRGHGLATITVGEDVRPFRWRASNTQFHSLYFDRFRTAYEPDVTLFVVQNLPAGGCFWDGGSNWGHLSGAAVANRPGAKAIAFEPNPNTFRDLLGFCIDAGLTDSILALPYGLSDSTHRATVCLPDGLHSGLAETHDDASGIVALTRGDCLPLMPPDVVKLDVEGAEYESLLGMSGIFTARRPHLVFESFESLSRRGGFLEIHRLLSEWGYDCYARENIVVEPRGDGEVNIKADLILVTAGSRKDWPDKINVFCYPRT